MKNNTTKARVVLTSYDCGEMTEDEYDSWNEWCSEGVAS